MAKNLDIKNVQARIDQSLYDSIQDLINEHNDKVPDNKKSERLNWQKVIVDALEKWIRTNQGEKDPLKSIDGLFNK